MPTYGDFSPEIKIPLLPREKLPADIETGFVPNNSVNSASARRLPVVAALFHHPFFYLLFTYPYARKRRKDRKSTRLNSSHVRISYAVFCLKKKKYQSLSCL